MNKNMFLPYCVSGVLPKVKEHYGIGNAEAGALQTIFVSSYMIVAPIFGYLGDRWDYTIDWEYGLGDWENLVAAPFLKLSFQDRLRFLHETKCQWRQISFFSESKQSYLIHFRDIQTWRVDSSCAQILTIPGSRYYKAVYALFLQMCTKWAILCINGWFPTDMHIMKIY